jgi:hypothetical protein
MAAAGTQAKQGEHDSCERHGIDVVAGSQRNQEGGAWRRGEVAKRNGCGRSLAEQGEPHSGERRGTDAEAGTQAEQGSAALWRSVTGPAKSRTARGA